MTLFPTITFSEVMQSYSSRVRNATPSYSRAYEMLREAEELVLGHTEAEPIF